MKKTIITLAIIATVTTGCTSRYAWQATKPGMDFNADMRQCEYEAQRHGNYAIQENSTGGAILSGIESGWQINKLRKLCMEAKGYRLVAKSDLRSAPQPAPKGKGSMVFTKIPKNYVER